MKLPLQLNTTREDFTAIELEIQLTSVKEYNVHMILPPLF